MIMTILQYLSQYSYKFYAVGGAILGFSYELLTDRFTDLLFDAIAAMTTAFFGMLGGLLAKYYMDLLAKRRKKKTKK